MARKTRTIHIMQFGERAISCLRVRPGATGVSIEGHEVERGHWRTDDGSLGAALADFAKRHELVGGRLYTVLPRHDIAVRMVTLPTQDPAEVARMVEFSAEEYVPYALEDLVIDQCILSPLPDGQSRVLAVLAHKDVIEGHLRLLRGAGLAPEEIFLSTACIASAIASARVPTNERCAYVNLAPEGWEALVMNGRQLDYTRGVASAQDWSSSGSSLQDALDELAAEVRASLSAYRRESDDGQGAETIHLCSDWTSVEAIGDRLSAELGMACSRAGLGASLVAQGGERMETPALALIGGALAAQGRDPFRIHLIPRDLREARVAQAGRRAAMRVGMLVAAVVVGLGVIYGDAIYQRQAYSHELEARIGRVRAAAEGVAAKQKQLQLIQSHLDRTGGVLELLARLTDLAPPSGLNVSQVTYKRGDSFTVEGRTDNKDNVNRLAEELRRSGVPQFVATTSGDLKQVEERGKIVWQYVIRTKLSPDATEAGDASTSEGTAGE